MDLTDKKSSSFSSKKIEAQKALNTIHFSTPNLTTTTRSPALKEHVHDSSESSEAKASTQPAKRGRKSKGSVVDFKTKKVQEKDHNAVLSNNSKVQTEYNYIAREKLTNICHSKTNSSNSISAVLSDSVNSAPSDEDEMVLSKIRTSNNRTSTSIRDRLSFQESNDVTIVTAGMKSISQEPREISTVYCTLKQAKKSKTSLGDSKSNKDSARPEKRNISHSKSKRNNMPQNVTSKLFVSNTLSDFINTNVKSVTKLKTYQKSKTCNSTNIVKSVAAESPSVNSNQRSNDNEALTTITKINKSEKQEPLTNFVEAKTTPNSIELLKGSSTKLKENITKTGNVRKRTSSSDILYGISLEHKTDLQEPNETKKLKRDKNTDGNPDYENSIYDEKFTNKTNTSNSSDSLSETSVCGKNVSTISDEKITCGVCNVSIAAREWITHIAKDHNYFAWEVGEEPLDLNDMDQLCTHIANILKTGHKLKCYICGTEKKYPKSFVRHLKYCESPKKEEEEDDDSKPLAEEAIEVTCGVCNKKVNSPDWLKHSGAEHNYLAWQEGDAPLNLDDSDELCTHISKIAKAGNKLICNLCGMEKIYPKPYLRHVKSCGALKDQNCSDMIEDAVDVVCGVCRKTVRGAEWVNHISLEHNYIAWREGEPAISLGDRDIVLQHLERLTSKARIFVCANCGLRRHQTDKFYGHIKQCVVIRKTDVVQSGSEVVVDGNVTCGVCSVKVSLKNWEDHAMMEHYNIAWKVGELPVDYNSFYKVISPLLKSYQKRFGKLECKLCKSKRVSEMGFYAHILFCGKTEQETEHLRGVCEICNASYLLIYKYQHYNIHEVQERMKEKKALKAAIEEQNKEEPEDTANVSGKRKSAQKAIKVMEEYSKNLKYNCPKCGCGTDYKNELRTHKCTVKETAGSGDGNFKACSDDGESSESAVDSGLSEAEEESHVKGRKIRLRVPAQRLKLPFGLGNPAQYVKKGAIDFIKKHFTQDTLYPSWRHCVYKLVREEDEHKYLPRLQESCKIRFDDSEWATYKRFQAVDFSKYCCLFAGACIQCLCWVPTPAEFDNYMAISTHLAHDIPRIDVDDLEAGPGFIQIWNFGKFDSTPSLVMGLAHDFGTVWSMDWCPSGACDVPIEENDQHRRLGLMAVACSDGHTYILSVPHPDTLNSKQIYIKPQPVADLRFSMTSDRKTYQPTSVRWSRQKGHSLIIVGYSDGYTALFDLSADNPLLVSKEDDLTIFYPFEEDRLNKACVLDVDISPYSGAVPCLGRAGVTGAEVRIAGVRVRSSAAARRSYFMPHWPALWTAVQEPFQTARDVLDFSGVKHHSPYVRALAACEQCGVCAAHQPPYLHTMPSHPAWDFDKNRIVLAHLWLSSLSNKRSKQVNDDLSVKIEPTTYKEVKEQYGLAFKYIKKSYRDVHSKMKCDVCPERFPLDNVTSMAYCSGRFHTKLAMSTHAGFVFLIST